MSLTCGNTKLCLVPEFDNLELFQAKSIHYTYARHSHPDYSIGIIEAGVGGNYYQGSTYLAPPGSIILMNPDEAHTGYSANNLPLTYRMLYPSVNIIKQLAKEVQVCEFPYFKEAFIKNEVLAKNIYDLHTVLEQSQNQLERQSMLVEVVSAILIHYADINIRLDKLGKEQSIVNLIKEYLYDNFSSNISLEDLVKLTNLNRYYLIRLFRKVIGMPPYAYLNQIRVQKAKQFLSKGIPIADVALSVGMSDQSHLNRHFKRIVGVTPGYYRSMMSTSFKTKPH